MKKFRNNFIFTKLKEINSKNLFSYHISKLGILPRNLYKKELSKIMNKNLEKIEDDQNNQIINSYQEYKQIFDNLTNIKENINKNIQIKFDIKLSDGLRGKIKTIIYDQIIKCSECSQNKNMGEKCKFCNSTGIIKKMGINFICPYCKGYGFHNNKKCGTCHNKILYRRKNQVDLKLGKEFYEGISYSFPNSGNYDFFTQQYGALRVKPILVSEKVNNIVELKVVNESQVESEEEVNLTTMTLGGNHQVTHALGTCEILIEPCTQPGDYKVINNIGIPNYFDQEENEMHKGSQIVFFNLKVLKIGNNSELKKLFEDLAKFDNLEELNKMNKVDVYNL